MLDLLNQVRNWNFDSDTTNTCFILNFIQVPKDDSGQLNFEDLIQLEETKKVEALKPLQEN